MLNIIIWESFLLLINLKIKKFLKKFFIYKNNKKKINFIKKGKYLTIISNCISCHTLNGGKPFSGGVPMKTNFGVIYTPNITFNKIYGIGKLNLKNFLKIIKTGISKKNKFLYPIFPYINYSNIKNIDIKCIYKFIKNFPKSNIPNKKNIIKFPFKYKNLLLIWRLFFFKKYYYKNFKKFNNNLKRGFYLVNILGHCSMCHTKLNILGKNIEKLEFLGTKIEKRGWYSLPIINNRYLNLKNKNIQDIYNLLKLGINKKQIIFGSMSNVIKNSLQYLNIIDIKSISSYIKTKFNKNIFFIKKININNYNKNISKIFFKKGKMIYKNNCLNCHGKNFLGNFPNYPSLNKNIINKYFINNIINLLNLNNSLNTFKNFYKSIMPNFNFCLNKKKIKYLINFLYFIKNLNK